MFDGDDCLGWCQFGAPDEVPRIKSRAAYEKGLTTLPDWRIACNFVGKGLAQGTLPHAGASQGVVAPQPVGHDNLFMRVAVLVALILVVCGCGSHAHVTNAGTRLYVPGPDGPPSYEPTGGIYVSPDGADQWGIDHWFSYGGLTARASGGQSVNNCTPSCVAGHHSSATVTVVFSGRVPCQGKTAYAEMTVTRTSDASVTPVGSGLDLTSFCGYVAYRPGLSCLTRDRRAVSVHQQKSCFVSANRIRARKIASARGTTLELLAPGDRIAFRRSESAWRRYRQASCAVVASIYAGGTYEPVLREACMFDRDNAHLLDLATFASFG